MKVKSSAPGKLMLLGEHAVVYGYPCIVTAVDKRIYIDLEKINNSNDQFITPQVKDSRFLQEAINLFRKKHSIKDNFKITTKGDFSNKVGLGSSSAVTIAIIRALVQLYNFSLTPKEIFKLGYEVNLNIQKVGSGFDIASATFGGTIYFITGGKKIEKIKTEVLPLVIGYSGIKADTVEIVKNLKLEMQEPRVKTKIKNLFKEIAKLVEKGKVFIKQNKWDKLGVLMTKNHELLKDLGVSTEKLDKMCEAALSAGAYGAKLSGAGGGDCMITLVDQKKRKAVEEAIIKVGGEIIEVKNNCEGVRIEKK